MGPHAADGRALHAVSAGEQHDSARTIHVDCDELKASRVCVAEQASGTKTKSKAKHHRHNIMRSIDAAAEVVPQCALWLSRYPDCCFAFILFDHPPRPDPLARAVGASLADTSRQLSDHCHRACFVWPKIGVRAPAVCVAPACPPPRPQGQDGQQPCLDREGRLAAGLFRFKPTCMKW